MPPLGVHLPTLHYILWGRRGDGDALRINQEELAAQLGVNKHTVSRKIRDLIAAGRLQPVDGSPPGGRRLYVVPDPADFSDDD